MNTKSRRVSLTCLVPLVAEADILNCTLLHGDRFARLIPHKKKDCHKDHFALLWLHLPPASHQMSCRSFFHLIRFKDFCPMSFTRLSLMGTLLFEKTTQASCPTEAFSRSGGLKSHVPK